MKDLGKDQGQIEIIGKPFFLEFTRQRYITTEEYGNYSDYSFRFVSLKNGAKGLWRTTYCGSRIKKYEDCEDIWEEDKKKAIADGDEFC